jgi:phage baseplate assembly protein W
MATKNYFRDLDFNFQPNPITKDVAVKEDGEAVKRALRNLILLKRYEKPFHPEISSGVQDLLFENYNPVTYAVMKSQIEDIIRRHEQRIENLEVSFDPSPDQNSITINILFTIINKQEVFQTSIFLERTR